MSMITMHFLPGEKAISTKSIADGILILTNYRIIFSTRKPHSSWSIPLTLVWKAEAFEMIHIKIITKIGISVTWSFLDEIACDAGYNHISSLIDIPKDIDSLFACKFRSSLEANIPSHPFLLSACELLQINDVDSALDTALVCFEFRRMNFDEAWKITDINNEFKICSTYPRHHIVPRSISDNDVINMASFRSHNRFLTVVWRSQVTGAVLLRCAQPCVGLMCSRNEYDEKFLRTVLSCCPKKPVANPNKDTHRLMIVDARSRSSAQFNPEVVFMDLPNLHTVRSNFEALTNLFAGKCPNWFSSLEKSSWLNNIGQLLKTATEIAIALEENARPVMVHCTDGWDRTPQISSLAQLLADPFYRTIQGFNILVEREWLQFGHKFADRSGHPSLSSNLNEQSPIFLQWLDCVHQIRRQFPHCFEFNESYLLKLGLHICSNLFGTFLCNSEQERQKASVASRTCSLWGLLSPKYNWTIVNYFYEPEAEHLLQPDCQIRSLSLWNTFYGIALSTNKTNSVNLPQSSSETVSHDSTSFSNSNSFVSHTKHTSLSSIKPTVIKTNSISNLNCEQLSQSTGNTLNDNQPSESPKVLIPDVKIDASEELQSVTMNTDSFIKGTTSERNSRRRSLNDLTSQLDHASVKQQLSNRVSPTAVKSSNHNFYNNNNNNLSKGKSSPEPAILRLSSFSDDTGICSSFSKTYLRSSLSSFSNGDGVFSGDPNNKCISPESNGQLTMSTCTCVNQYQQQECVLSPVENTDVFTADEQLEQNDFSFNNDNNDNTNNNDSNNQSSGRLFYTQFNHCSQNCQFYGKCSPLSISSRNFEFNEFDDSNINDSTNSGSNSKMPCNFHLDGAHVNSFVYNSPRWSVTTRGSNASLYFLSDMKQTSAEQIKPVPTQPMDIKTSYKSDNHNLMHTADSICPNDFIVHSLPENDEVLVNGTESITCDLDNSPNENNDLNFSTPLGESLSGQIPMNAANPSTFSNNRDAQNWKDIHGAVCKMDEVNSDDVFTTKFSELLIPEDLLNWRSKYFRSEYFPNIPSQSSSSSSYYCGERNSCSDQMLDSTATTTTVTTTNNTTTTIHQNNKSLKSGASFDLKTYSTQVNPKVSLPEFTHIMNNEIDINHRPTSAPISPTLCPVTYFSSPTLHKNISPLNTTVRNLFTYQKPLDNVNSLDELHKKPLSSALMNTLSSFSDWDGLPILVDRLTVHAHSQLCQERYNRKTQKQSVLSLEAKLKYAQLEIARLNSETERLKQLLEMNKSRAHNHIINNNHEQVMSDTLVLLSNNHSSPSSDLLTNKLFVTTSIDENA
uniref:Myotubularin phosphatase domain-containing protein n=1 Tax=Trichobilharzia regenti TaxID=157069 RepID=A0AA85KFW6_TRIRE|nr:unnamed protein product [Trichobilharzia regenti]